MVFQDDRHKKKKKTINAQNQLAVGGKVVHGELADLSLHGSSIPGPHGEASPELGSGDELLILGRESLRDIKSGGKSIID
jgi:hypothetical protein